jgi:hypothetical protein
MPAPRGRGRSRPCMSGRSGNLVAVPGKAVRMGAWLASLEPRKGPQVYRCRLRPGRPQRASALRGGGSAFLSAVSPLPPRERGEQGQVRR